MSVYDECVQVYMYYLHMWKLEKTFESQFFPSSENEGLNSVVRFAQQGSLSAEAFHWPQSMFSIVLHKVSTNGHIYTGTSGYCSKIYC